MPLAVPTLALVDDADGAGATATISGSTAGTTNTVYTTRWLGGFVNAAFVAAGNRAGDGALALTLPLGYHWAYVSSTKAGEDGVVSAMGSVRATDGEDSDWKQCMDAIVAKIQTLSLSGLLPANVEGGKFPLDREDLSKPAILVGYIREAGISLVYSATDQIPLDFQVSLLKTNDRSNAIEDQFPKWREQIRNAFSPTTDTGLPAVPRVISTQVIPGDFYNFPEWKAGYDTGALVIRCLTQVNRALV